MNDKNTMTVSTWLDESGVWQRRDVLGEVTHLYARICAAQMDAKIRERLIELGWTPPPETP